MRILFLAPRLPLPLDTGGKIRTFNILKQLAKVNTVHLVCFKFDKNDDQLAKQLHDLGITITFVKAPQFNIVQKIMAVLLKSMPFSIYKYCSTFMRETLIDLIRDNKFDAIHIDHLHMAHYEDIFEKIPCFLDEHNVEYKILERSALVEKSLIKKFIYMNQTYKMRVFEGRFTKLFDGIFACSLDDQLMISKLTIGLIPTHVIPNGVDTEFFNLPSLAKEDSLVFTGSMDWLPNDDAITYFCDKVLPLIWAKNPNVKLYVVGKSPSSSVCALAKHDNRVIVTGRVDDVRTFVQQAKIFIVPLRIGGGTRLKILEAMAMRKAIVSTSIGAEGIEYKDNVDICIADKPEELAKTILALLPDSAKMASLGESGRDLVCQKYDWSIVGKKLNAIYQEAINASK